jgi:hypothetical protein
MVMNVQAALDEGYSQSEIMNELARRQQFNVLGAKSEGYSDEEIFEYLRQKDVTSPENIPVGNGMTMGDIEPPLEKDFIFDEGALRNAEKDFKKIAGDRLGMDPETYEKIRPYAGIFTPLVDAGAAILEGIGGTTAAGISLGADALGAMGVPNTRSLKRDLQGMVLESPIPATNLAPVKFPTTRGRVPSPTIDRTVDVTLKAKDKVEKVGETVADVANTAVDKIYNPERVASRVLGDTLKLDNIEPSEISDRVADWTAKNQRVPNLIELSGENTVALARDVGTQVGESRNVIEKFRIDTLEGQTELVKDIAGRALSDPKFNINKSIKSLEESMKKNSAPLYDAAYKQFVPLTDEIQSLLRTPDGKSAMKNAVRLLQQERIDLGELGITIEKGKIQMGDEVSVRLLDYIKRGFDDVLEKNRDTTTNRLVLDNRGRATNNSLRELINEVDDLSPEYAKARQAYAGPASLRNAMNDGRDAGKLPRVTADNILVRLSRMTNSEKEVYRSGFFQGLIDIMESGVKDTNRVRKLIRSEGLRKKLSAVMENPEAADKFIDMLIEAEKNAGRAQQVSSKINSTTQPSQQAATSFRLMSPVDVVTGVIRGSYGKLRQNRNIRNEQLKNNDISEMLTQPLTEENITKIIKRLEK